MRTRRGSRASLVSHADDADVPRPPGAAVDGAGPDGRVGHVTVIAQRAAPLVESDPLVAEIRPPSAEAISKRNREAEALWNEHYARLAGWCASMTGSHADAHDIATEAFTRLLARWFSVRDPKGFLYVAATNLVRDRWRHQQRDGALVKRLQPLTTGYVDPADVCVRDAVERLPERLRAPLLLFVWADLPVKEVAAALHRTEGSVKRQLNEARAQLRLDFEVPE